MANCWTSFRNFVVEAFCSSSSGANSHGFSGRETRIAIRHVSHAFKPTLRHRWRRVLLHSTGITWNQLLITSQVIDCNSDKHLLSLIRHHSEPLQTFFWPVQFVALKRQLRSRQHLSPCAFTSPANHLDSCRLLTCQILLLATLHNQRRSFKYFNISVVVFLYDYFKNIICLIYILCKCTGHSSNFLCHSYFIINTLIFIHIQVFSLIFKFHFTYNTYLSLVQNKIIEINRLRDINSNHREIK